MVVWADCRCFLSLVFLGGAKRLELSPCDTHILTGHVHRTLVSVGRYTEAECNTYTHGGVNVLVDTAM